MIYSSHGKKFGGASAPQTPTCLWPWVAKYVHCYYCKATAKTTEISLRECSAYRQIHQSGGEREGPHSTHNDWISRNCTHTLNAVSRLAECVCTDCLLADMSVWYYGYLGAILQSEMHGGNQHTWILVKIFTVPPWKYTRPYLIGNKDC